MANGSNKSKTNANKIKVGLKYLLSILELSTRLDIVYYPLYVKFERFFKVFTEISSHGSLLI